MASNKPPAVNPFPGQPISIPSGYVLGRVSPGSGQAELLSLGKLQNAGLSPSSLPPHGSAGGDLSGTYPNPTVAALQGSAVSNVAPTNLQVLRWITASMEWVATTLLGLAPAGGTTGQVLEKNSGTDYDYSWQTPSGGGGGSQGGWAVPLLSSGNFNNVDGSAHATKGICIEPVADITIDKVIYFSDGAINAHNLICSVWSVNTSTNALVAQVGTTATATGQSAAGPITFTVSPAVSLVAGTAYAILVTDTSAASGTTSIDMYCGGTQTVPTYPALPSALNDHNTNGASFVISTNMLPVSGTNLSGASVGSLAIMFRFQG